MFKPLVDGSEILEYGKYRCLKKSSFEVAKKLCLPSTPVTNSKTIEMVQLIRSLLLRGETATKILRRSIVTDVITRPSNYIGLLGICEDRNSSYLQGTAQAPAKIRECFNCDSSNSYSELKIDIAPLLCDYGDFIPQKDFSDVEKNIRRVLEDHRVPLILGGDHSITAPVVFALNQFYSTPITIVHFDAHPDLYPIFQDNPRSHASPFARILEQDNICQKLIQIGIRTITPPQQAQIHKYQIDVIEAKDFPAKGTVK